MFPAILPASNFRTLLDVLGGDFVNSCVAIEQFPKILLRAMTHPRRSRTKKTIRRGRMCFAVNSLYRVINEAAQIQRRTWLI